MTEYLDYSGLTDYDTKIKQYISSQSGSNTTYDLTLSGGTITLEGSDGSTDSISPEIQNLTNFGTRVYDATISRTANTFLGAPNGSAGAASFRALVSADVTGLTCKSLFNSTAATSVTLSETAANFKFLIVKLAINSGKSKYHFAVAQSGVTSEFTCSIKTGTTDVYFKGGELVSSAKSLKVQNLWAVHAASNNTTGVESESNIYIKQVWGLL